MYNLYEFHKNLNEMQYIQKAQIYFHEALIEHDFIFRLQTHVFDCSHQTKMNHFNHCARAVVTFREYTALEEAHRSSDLARKKATRG